MAYKGEDLDLRVPQPRIAREPDPVSAPNGALARTERPAPPPEPIWVDEIVLQCCNYAFDVALARGAAEVGLEHLVHALTRVDAAALLLEANGVREGQLRRESVSLLAAELATSRSADRAAPHRSNDLESVLRRASHSAGRRGRAASVDDVLWATLDHGRNVPAVALLRRLTPDWQRQSGSGAGDEDFAAPAVLSTDERRAFAEFLRDFRTQTGSHTTERGLDAPRDRAGIGARMHTLEQAVHSGLGQGARNWAALTQRLQALEAAASARSDEHDEAFSERLSGIEAALEGRIQEGGSRWTALIDQLSTMETLIRSAGSDPNPQGAELVDRLAGLERTVRAGFGETVRMSTDLGERVGGVVAAAKQRAPLDQAAQTKLAERLASIEIRLEGRLGESARLATQVIERLGAVETLVSGQAAKLEAPMSAQFAQMDDKLATRFAQTSKQIQEAGDRLLVVEQIARTGMTSLDEETQLRDRELQDMQDAIVRLAENQHTLASAIADWRHAVHTDLGAVNSRIDKLIGLMIPSVPPAPAAAHSPASSDAPTRLPTAISAPSSTRTDTSDVDVNVDAGKRGMRSWLFGASEPATVSGRERRRTWLAAAMRRVVAARVRIRDRSRWRRGA